ncbi:MAG TPA: DUF6364 family protein [Mucilaginibacter sp.]
MEKLTLSMDKDTIQIAKEVASESNMSVSKLVKSLILEIDKKRKKKNSVLEKFKDVKISPEIEALSGILKGKYPDDITLWDAKWEYLKEKYDL